MEREEPQPWFVFCKISSLIILSLIVFNYRYNKVDYYKKAHIKIMRETAGECTLFLNRNQEFPIKKPGNVLLIGSGARNTIKGGLGSADVESRYYTTCEEGLEKAGFNVTSKRWLDQYPLEKEKKIQEYMDYLRNIVEHNNIIHALKSVSFPEYEYEKLKILPDEEKADIAVYVLARNSGEGVDRRIKKGDVLLTETEIFDILYLNQTFKKFMLVLNVGGVVDLSPVAGVSNILLLSQLGVVTGDILADIILGKVNPSGKLATTWAAVDDYKFINYFGNVNDTIYKEGVYVGYRYFDSANVTPLYPFGFGLSYTSFKISIKSITSKHSNIKIKIKVKNIGNFTGKEVVQVYISPPYQNVNLPYQSLILFKKTGLIKPEKEIEMALSFKFEDAARYDEKIASYVLDAGTYVIRVGNCSRNTKIAGIVKISETIVTKKMTNAELSKVLDDYEIVIKKNEYLEDAPKIILNQDDFEVEKFPKKDFYFKINKEISKLNDSDLAYICIGGFLNKSDPNEYTEKGKGYAGYTTKKIKKIKNFIKMADGPGGLRLTRVSFKNATGYYRLSEDNIYLSNYFFLSILPNISLVPNKKPENYSEYNNTYYQYTTALPIATAIAQSFNVDLAQKYGEVVGKEMKIYNIQLLLAPALNIHRNILCGRNFEYYSEDPVITGKMAAGFIRGIQSYENAGATIKHFAANNQETNRLNSNSVVSERALREIYLKGFEIAIKESQPIALMTSYNLINRIHPSENPNLLIDVLRKEWGFKGLVMTDWIKSGDSEYNSSFYPAQYVHRNLKGGNNLMMPGSQKDYELILKNLDKGKLKRKDLLKCASKVYETIKLLTK